MYVFLDIEISLESCSNFVLSNPIVEVCLLAYSAVGELGDFVWYESIAQPIHWLDSPLWDEMWWSSGWLSEHLPAVSRTIFVFSQQTLDLGMIICWCPNVMSWCIIICTWDEVFTNSATSSCQSEQCQITDLRRRLCLATLYALDKRTRMSDRRHHPIINRECYIIR
jgi:hypothetical protein